MFADFLSEPLFVRLFRSWHLLRAERAMPRRRDIDPVALGADLLPYIAIIELCDEGRRPRFRLLGTKLVERFGRDYTGRFLDEFLSGAYYEHIRGIYRDVYVHRRPIYDENVFRWSEMNHVWAKRLILPLSESGGDPEFAIGAQLFSSNASGDRKPKNFPIEPPEIERIHSEVLDADRVGALLSD